jgi:hypothetical protein
MISIDTILPNDVMVCPLPHLLALIEAGTIKATDLVPAYGGESAGLDLYNVGPSLQVLPVLAKGQGDFTSGNFDSLPDTTKISVYKTLMPTGIKVAILAILAKSS